MSDQDSAARRATTKAFALLARRDYTRQKLRAKLLAGGFDAEAVEAACARCEELGAIDDRSYARNRVEVRLERRPTGRADAVRDLRRQGVAVTMGEAVVDEVFAEAGGDEAVLRRAFDRWVARHGEPESLRDAKRCFDHLMRRRFPRSLVLKALSPWLDELSS